MHGLLGKLLSIALAVVLHLSSLGDLNPFLNCQLCAKLDLWLRLPNAIDCKINNASANEAKARMNLSAKHPLATYISRNVDRVRDPDNKYPKDSRCVAFQMQGYGCVRTYYISYSPWLASFE